MIHDFPEPDQLASHLANKVLGHLDCRAVAIGVIEKEGFLDLIGYYGLSKSTTSPYLRMPLWSKLPMTEAARTGEFISLKNYDELIKRFPTVSHIEEHRDAATVASPITHRNTIIGSIAFSSMRSPQDDFRTNPLTDAALALVGLYIRLYMDRKSENIRENSRELKELTERQKQIIKLFREDLTVEQMADRLRFSASTIKQDIIKIYDLFGVSSREQVVALAEHAFLI